MKVMKIAKKDNKIFNTFIEFQKEVFPDSYKKKENEEKIKQLNNIGKNLAKDFFNRIRKDLE